MRAFALLLVVFVAIFTAAYLNVFHPVGDDHRFVQEYS